MKKILFCLLFSFVFSFSCEDVLYPIYESDCSKYSSQNTSCCFVQPANNDKDNKCLSISRSLSDNEAALLAGSQELLHCTYRQNPSAKSLNLFDCGRPNPQNSKDCAAYSTSEHFCCLLPSIEGNTCVLQPKTKLNDEQDYREYVVETIIGTGMICLE